MSNQELLQAAKQMMQQLTEGEDFYWEGGYLVFTRAYHLKRGYCCGSGCRHCPYEPSWCKGATTVNTNENAPP
jgi:hypothetical protein